jgi:hypothetical protein
MGNFADVLLRRYVAVADALSENGDDPVIERRAQLVHLNKLFFALTGDDPANLASIFKRRVGIFHRALVKKLNDAPLTVRPDSSTLDEANDEFSAWPSFGTLLLLRSLSHVFPVTDKSHPVITPALLLMAQALTASCVRKGEDVVKGLMVAQIMFNFTAGDAKYTANTRRLAPEPLAFVSSVLRLFSGDKRPDEYEVETVGVASKSVYIQHTLSKGPPKPAPMDLFALQDAPPAKILARALSMAISLATTMASTLGAEPVFADAFEGMGRSAALLAKATGSDKGGALALAEKLAGIRADNKMRKPLQMNRKASAVRCARASARAKRAQRRPVVLRASDKQRWDQAREEGIPLRRKQSRSASAKKACRAAAEAGSFARGCRGETPRTPPRPARSHMPQVAKSAHVLAE